MPRAVVVQVIITSSQIPKGMRELNAFDYSTLVHVQVRPPPSLSPFMSNEQHHISHCALHFLKLYIPIPLVLPFVTFSS